MRKSLLLLSLPAAVLLAFIFPPEKEQPTKQRRTNVVPFDCAPDYNPFTGGNSISPLSGWGNYQWKIKTTSDSAQYYFNQGISMYYAFHIIEARASFAKVTELDPQCAIGWWALALSFGPNINDFEYTAPPDALAAARKAESLSNFYTPKEKALIHAINIRYSDDTSKSRESLNKAYAAAMKQAMKDIPNDADIATLYADALMLLHPWDLYNHDMSPKPWTPELVQVIEKALKLNPNNPGANHYYIHAVEASANPGRALASADRLPGLMPNVAHLVHMPSHIYIRTGNYTKGSKVNIDALKGYEKYLQEFPEVEGNAFLYSIHNLHMEATCNQMAGHFEKSKASATKTHNSVPPDYLSIPGPMGHYIQYIYSTPLLTMVRFGKWDEALTATVPDSITYAKALLHFARGMAFARTGQNTHATYELTQLRVKMNEDASLKEPFTPFNSAYTACQITAEILAGALAESSGNLTGAIEHYKKGVALEDGMVYNEPKDWILPIRHYLGNALLKAKKYSEAETVFIEDLRINPLNAWAITGLHQAQTQQRKTTQAAPTLKLLKKAASGTDIEITASVF
jgi:tetratricopeptide (TPR) repeat protein